MNDAIPRSYAYHTVNILRVAAGSRAKVLSALEDLEGHLVGKVATASTKNRLARFEALLNQTQTTISKTYEKISASQTKDLKGLARMEGKQTRAALTAGIGADILGVGWGEKLLESVVDEDSILGHSSKSWWKQQEAGLQNTFAGGMRQGILAGESNDQLIRRVRGTTAAGFADGMMSKSRREAAALVRSSAIAVANTAKLKSFDELGHLMKGIQWLATLDGRTTLICMGLSGKMWRLGTYEPIGHDKAFPGATAHWQCRSTQIPVLKSWEELSGKKLPELDDKDIETRMKEKLAKMGMNQQQIDAARVNTRASMDGQVNADISFDEWLGGKDDTFINNTLGPGRAKLWNRGKGKILLSDLTNQDNRPITLAMLDGHLSKGLPIPETSGVSYFSLDPAGRIADITETIGEITGTGNLLPLGPPAMTAAEAKKALPREVDYDEELGGSLRTNLVHNHELEYPDEVETIGLSRLKYLQETIGKVETVQIADILSSQGIIHENRLMAALTWQYDPNFERPVLVRFGGKLYVMDGNHRVNAELLKGAKDIHVDVIDLDRKRKR